MTFNGFPLGVFLLRVSYHIHVVIMPPPPPCMCTGVIIPNTVIYNFHHHIILAPSFDKLIILSLAAIRFVYCLYSHAFHTCNMCTKLRFGENKQLPLLIIIPTSLIIPTIASPIRTVIILILCIMIPIVILPLFLLSLPLWSFSEHHHSHYRYSSHHHAHHHESSHHHPQSSLFPLTWLFIPLSS